MTTGRVGCRPRGPCYRWSGSTLDKEAQLRDQFERILARMDMVIREKFEAVRAMAVKAREEQESLAKRRREGRDREP